MAGSSMTQWRLALFAVAVLMAAVTAACSLGPVPPRAASPSPALSTAAAHSAAPVPSASVVAGEDEDDDDAPVPTPSGLPANNGGSLVDAARAVTDACAVLPMDLVGPLVPGASAPQASSFPTRCTVTNQTQVVEVTISPSDPAGPLDQAETVPGLGATAYLQQGQPDDAYVKVVLDPSGGAISVEVAGHDGRDHGEDAVAIARAVLARLGA